METLSIIIPCYNEEKTIQKVVDQVSKVVLPGNIQKEIIIVDDGSNDNSREIIQSLASDPRSGITIKPIFQPQNGGKGTAVITGFKNATGDYIIIQDGDLEYSPEEYPSLIGPIHDGHADVVMVHDLPATDHIEYSISTTILRINSSLSSQTYLRTSISLMLKSATKHTAKLRSKRFSLIFLLVVLA